jgi:hypothetical protein
MAKDRSFGPLNRAHQASNLSAEGAQLAWARNVSGYVAIGNSSSHPAGPVPGLRADGVGTGALAGWAAAPGRTINGSLMELFVDIKYRQSRTESHQRHATKESDAQHP